MKKLTAALFVTLSLLSLTPINASASNFPGICENTRVYEDSSDFVQVPATIGGCITNLIGLPIGGLAGLPFGAVEEGAYVGGLMFNVAGNAITGAPFYALESIPKLINNKAESAIN